MEKMLFYMRVVGGLGRKVCCFEVFNYEFFWKYLKGLRVWRSSYFFKNNLYIFFLIMYWISIKNKN